LPINSSQEVSKEVSKIGHPFSKSSLEDLLKFFQTFSKEVLKIRILSLEKKSSKDLPKKFQKFGPWLQKFNTKWSQKNLGFW